MNIHDPNIATPKVTTGPIFGSRKVYANPDAATELRVPVREIALEPSSGEPPVPVYDTTGPYTDPDATIDVEQGLPRRRTAWVKERGGVEAYEGRPIKPVDNGNVSGKHLARAFPQTHTPLRALDGQPVTQYEFARAGVSRARRRRELRRIGAAVRDAGIRALGSGARPRHHSLQHQPRRVGADDH